MSITNDFKKPSTIASDQIAMIDAVIISGFPPETDMLCVAEKLQLEIPNIPDPPLIILRAIDPPFSGAPRALRISFTSAVREADVNEWIERSLPGMAQSEELELRFQAAEPVFTN